MDIQDYIYHCFVMAKRYAYFLGGPQSLKAREFEETAFKEVT